MHQLTITNQTRHKLNTRWLKRHLIRLLKLLKIKTAEWSITIVNDKAMSKLHAQTMNDPATTDVLTFDLRPSNQRRPLPQAARANGRAKTQSASDQEGAPVELDTVLCRDEAARRAKDLHHTVQKELLLYAIHSLLHVQGYDDLTPPDASRMHRREDELLIALGIGPLYAAPQKKPPRTPAGSKKK